MKRFAIDSHAHLTSQKSETLQEELKRADEAGVAAIVNIATDLPSLEAGLALEAVTKAPKIYTVASTTPHDVAKDGAHFFPYVEKAAREKKLVAIGETGLDYFYEHSPRELQKEYLRKYLRLAKAHALPVVIHCRDAFQDFYSIVDEEEYAHGVLHCFTGTSEEAKEGLKRGFYVSLSGIVTFKKSTVLQQVAKEIPLDRLLIETDAPFLAPEKYRGRKNESAYVMETAQMIAMLRQISVEELLEATSNNTRKLFCL